MADFPESVQPITLQGWPTCKDCLSWSDDHLAVAVGEVVHILHLRSPGEKATTAGHHDWRVATVRVNGFTYNEWPLQRLASIHHCSIGEEQSTSTVVALEWSPEGLGVHRRSVLAILTSNLLLSLWETDGASRNWSRTCIINQYIAGDADSTSTNWQRRKRRIRSFTWCKSFRNPESPGWGTFCLLVADDANTISVITIKKEAHNTFSPWVIRLVTQHTFQRPDTASTATKSLFRRTLNHQGPIHGIEHQNWQQLIDATSDNVSYHSLITIRWQSSAQTLRLQASIVVNNGPPNFALVSGIPSEAEDGSASLPIRSDEATMHHFRDSLRVPSLEFNETYGLAGRYKVTFWGVASSHDGVYNAACVTLHPRDMMEYQQPSSERCTVVVRRAENAAAILSANTVKDLDVQKRILKYIAHLGRPQSAFDESIFQAAKSLVSCSFRDDKDLTPLSSICDTNLQLGNAESEGVLKEMPEQGHAAKAMAQPDDAAALGLEPSPSGAFVQIAQEEQCELCHTNLDFATKPLLAKCKSGHVFTRCNLCFIALQEPGISKYCSRCGKQFLDVSKLESSNGPSLFRALFAEFDVCPYCQGKFRA